MSEFRVIISDEAFEQISATAGWYVRQSGSAEVGQEWQDGFLTAIDSLVDNPRRCSFAQESDKFPYELRMLLYGSGKRKSHRALFRIEGSIVRVLSIRHLSQRDVTPDDIAADE